jgi:hypothetical protein
MRLFGLRFPLRRSARLKGGWSRRSNVQGSKFNEGNRSAAPFLSVISSKARNLARIRERFFVGIVSRNDIEGPIQKDHE